jgi:hypothetical protein
MNYNDLRKAEDLREEARNMKTGMLQILVDSTATATKKERFNLFVPMEQWVQILREELHCRKIAMAVEAIRASGD